MSTKRRPSSTMVVALLALVLAVSSGTAFAAGKISGKSIKNGSIAAKKLKPKAIAAFTAQTPPTPSPVTGINITKTVDVLPGPGDPTPQIVYDANGFKIGLGCSTLTTPDAGVAVMFVSTPNGSGVDLAGILSTNNLFTANSVFGAPQNATPAPVGVPGTLLTSGARLEGSLHLHNASGVLTLDFTEFKGADFCALWGNATYSAVAEK